MKIIYLLIILTSFILNIKAQNTSSLDNLLPTEEIHPDSKTNSKKVSKQIMGIGAYVNISLICSLNDPDACDPKNSFSTGGLKIRFTWYNANDEAGKTTLQMQKDLNAIPQEMSAFKSECRFDDKSLKEEDFMNGKLWYTTSEKECINTISGGTGKINKKTHLAFFSFDGVLITRIEIECQCGLEKAKEMAKLIISNSKAFDFSPFASTVLFE